MLIELTDNEVKALQECIEMAKIEGYWQLTVRRDEFNTLLHKLNFSETDINYLKIRQ